MQLIVTDKDGNHPMKENITLNHIRIEYFATYQWTQYTEFPLNKGWHNDISYCTSLGQRTLPLDFGKLMSVTWSDKSHF